MTDLLAPRYLVIASYPTSRFAIGDIVIRSSRKGKENQWYIKGDSFKTINNPELYPILFRELHWWEYRSESDMPEFVKKSYGNCEVIKITRYHDTHKNIAFHIINGKEEYETLNYWKPSTKEEFEEYNQYQKQIKLK